MIIKTKKSLGQNFLRSKEIINIIIETSDIKDKDVILEIGPGEGVLTEKILKKAGEVIVVEKDDRLIDFLNDKFINEVKEGKLKIIHQDILEFDIEKFLNINYKNNKNFKYKIVANIPYYITGQIIRKFLSTDKQPSKMVLMVQKEVAKRIIDQKESLLSLSVKVYGEPKYIKTVKAKYFSPQPKVDSAVLLINDISKGFFDKNISEKGFFNLIKAGFSHKRKVLINNLKTDWNYAENLNKSDLEKLLEKSNIPLKSRAENLSKEDWKNILKNI